MLHEEYHKSTVGDSIATETTEGTRTPESKASRPPIMDPLRPEPIHGTLDRTAEPLAKLLSGSEDPDVTALSEAVKAQLGITEPLPKPAHSHLHPD